MINYARAYTEVLEIVSYFPENDYKKVPIELINFYKKNMDKNYNFKINPKVDLSSQNISKEANAIIVNIYRDYFATEIQKKVINEILDQNQKKEEQRKKEKYNSENIFKNKLKGKDLQSNSIRETSLVELNENIFAKLKRIVLKLLHFKR